MLKKIILLLIAVFIISGCGIFRIQSSDRNASSAPISGIYKTTDDGEVWSQIGLLYSVSQPIRSLTYTTLTFVDYAPEQRDTLFLGTDNGLYYSYDNGKGWFRTLAGEGTVNDIALDPDRNCTIYAAVHNKVLKSEDCARNWEQLHFSSLKGQFFKAIYVSSDDSKQIIVGTSDGALLQSRNAGRSWEILSFLDSPITTFVNNPHESKTFYVVTPKLGIQRTTDDGKSWSSLNALPVKDIADEQLYDKKGNPLALRSLSGSNVFFDLKFDRSQREGLLYASSYGIFRLIDGEYWQAIDVLSKPKEAKIYAVALDESDGQTIYFTTQGAFYKSINGGKDWTVRSLPANGLPQYIALNPSTASDVIVGFTQ